MIETLGQASAGEVWDLVREGGATAVLVLGIVALLRGWLHTDREFKAVEDRERFWREAAIRGLGAAERMASVTADVQRDELERVATATARAVVEDVRRHPGP